MAHLLYRQAPLPESQDQEERVAGCVCEIDTGDGCGQTTPKWPPARRGGEEMTDQKRNAAVSQLGGT
jgi:hypothetical protein